MNRVRVEASRWGKARRGKQNWKVIDDTGPKVFRRVFVYSYWGAAVVNAHRVARGQQISPHGLVSVLTER